MARKRFSAEQIVAKLRQAEVELAKGQTTNARLKKPVADQALDMAILKEAASGNF